MAWRPPPPAAAAAGIAVLAVLGGFLAHEVFVKPGEVGVALPRTDDVFIVSYPKSGNTWVRLLAGHLWTWARQEQLTLQTLEELIPDLEYGPNRRSFPVVGSPRIFKSHQPFTHARPPCDVSIGMQEEFNCACPNCPDMWRRIVYVVRDPRDALCSYYHFDAKLRKIDPSQLSFRQFAADLHYPGVSWADHVQSYLDAARNTTNYDVLFLRYEDLVERPHDTVTRLAGWAGLPAHADAVEFAVERSELETMRRLEEQHGLKFFGRHYRDRDPEFRMMRRGQVGAWKTDPLCGAQVANAANSRVGEDTGNSLVAAGAFLVDPHTRAVMRRFGYAERDEEGDTANEEVGSASLSTSGTESQGSS